MQIRDLVVAHFGQDRFDYIYHIDQADSSDRVLSVNSDNDVQFDEEFYKHLCNTYGAALRDRVFFFVDSRNELVPFEQDAFPGRTFYRNAGRSSRQGLESSYLLQWHNRWQLQLNYTYSDFRYQEYQTPDADYSEMRLPGLPQHLAQGQLRYQVPPCCTQGRGIGSAVAPICPSS